MDTVRFRRIVEGETRQYEIKRSWRVGTKGIEEGLQVWCNGEPDDLLTQNWSEYIEGYLPSSIAHLFFFDGEQIKELAEGEHAAEILGTAIQTLLGLDIVDSLESDLKVLERRKRAETLSGEATQDLLRLQRELQIADQEQETAMQELGRLTNAAGALAKDLRQAEDTFRKEGGEAFERRHALEASHAELQRDRKRILERLLELSSGAAPLMLVQTPLEGLEKYLAKESRVKKARLISAALEERDTALLSSLNFDDLPRGPRRKVAEWLERDRQEQKSLASEQPVLDADPQLAAEIAHMLRAVLPALQNDIEAEVGKLNRLDEGLLRIQAQQERIPAADTIAKLQNRVAATRAAHQDKMTERAAAEMRVAASQRHKEHLERQLSQLGLENVDERFAEEDRVRLLRHSEKVRATLASFRTAMIRKHSSRLEALILECFQQLLRKTNLVTRLSIHPETFTITLTGNDGNIIDGCDKPMCFRADLEIEIFLMELLQLAKLRMKAQRVNAGGFWQKVSAGLVPLLAGHKDDNLPRPTCKKRCYGADIVRIGRGEWRIDHKRLVMGFTKIKIQIAHCLMNLAPQIGQRANIS